METFNETDFAGTIFETKEDKEARRRAEITARWNKEIAKAAAASPDKCQAQVYGSGRYSSFHGHSCQLKAKFHREEHVDSYDKESPTITRHYCGTHDPVSCREREEKKWAQEKREREAKWASEERARNRSALVSEAVGHLTSEQLIELAKFLQSTPFAKVGK